MALANSNGRSGIINRFLNRCSPEKQAKIIQDDIDHEPNIYNFRGITPMLAPALGCLCVMQVWGQSINPLSKERRLREQGCFPLQKWLYAFQGSLYLFLTNIKERDALEFWREFSATSQWKDVWKPWTESLKPDDIIARWCYIKWLIDLDDDQSLKLKWGNAVKDVFRFRKNETFGFEIVEIFNRPNWLGDAYSATDFDSSELGEGSHTRRL